MTKITLLALIEVWLKTRGLKWKCDPETSKLTIDGVNHLDIMLDIEKDRVTYAPTTFCDNVERVSIVAIDPFFFQKLEAALKREGRWSNCSKCIVLLLNGLIAVWGPLINVIVLWTINRIDSVQDWYERLRAEYFPRQEL
jgi:hypothetical protein